MNPVIGVAGCGVMGLNMALQLQENGFQVWGHDVRPAAAFGGFAPRMMADARAFAERCDVVLCMVMNVEQIFDLCFGTEGLFTVEDPPGTLIIGSTISPRELPAIGARLPAGTVLVDAPVAGSHIAAETGTLTFMIGGDAAHVAALMPFFEAMGETIHHAGPLGAGLTCKVVNNFVLIAAMVAVRKGIALAGARGVGEDTMRRVLATSSGDTWYGRNLDRVDWGRLGYADDVPGNTLPILEKDLKAYLDTLADVPDLAPGGFEDALQEALCAQQPLP